LGRRDFLHLAKIALFAALDEFLGDGLEFLPAGSDRFGFSGGDLAVGGRGGHDGQKISEFLNNAVHRGHQMEWMGLAGVGISDKKAAGTVTKPLHDAVVAAATDQDRDAIEGIGRAAAAVRRFGPFVDHGKGKAHLGGGLFGADLLKHFAQEFVGLHAERMAEKV